MPDQPFIVNDRRKFTAEGDLRPDAPASEPKPPRPEAEAPAPSGPQPVPAAGTGPQAVPPAAAAQDTPAAPAELPPLTDEQVSESTRAYDATVDRLDTAIRAANPGADHMPPMSFERVIQSLYMQAIFQLGGTAEEGQQPRVDLLGARQTIDMLGIIAEKSKGNLTSEEDRLVQTVLFEARMGFLEVTQAFARQAAERQAAATGKPAPPAGPSIVR